MKGENKMSSAQLAATLADMSPEDLKALFTSLTPEQASALGVVVKVAPPEGTHVDLDGDILSFQDVIGARFDEKGAPFKGDDEAIAPLTVHAVVGMRTEWATGGDGMNRRRFVPFTGEDRTSWGIATLVVVYCPNPEAEFPFRTRVTASVGNGSQLLRELDAPIFRTSLEAREVLTPGVIHYPLRRAVAHLFGRHVDLVSGTTRVSRLTAWDEDGPAATAFKVASGMQRGGGSSGKTQWVEAEAAAPAAAPADEDIMSAEDEDLLSSLG